MTGNRSRLPEPAGWPFFYGWMILFAGGLGTLMTAPGQTIGVSVFNDFLIDVLGISRVALSTAYMIGTTTSGLLLVRAGRVLDRRGSRVVGTAAAVGLGLSVLGMTQVDRASQGIARLTGGTVWPAFVAVTFGFFLLRFFGQGMLMLSARNMILKWFDKRRGIVTALLGLTVTLGFSYSPRVFEALIQSYSWRAAWAAIAASVLCFAVFAAVFYRDNPASVGLKPDGAVRTPASPRRARFLPRRLRELRPVGASTGEDHTLEEARRTLIYWVLILVLTFSSAIGTAFTFHVVSVFDTGGMSRTAAVSVFLPASVVSIAVKFATSWASDYVSMRVFPILHGVAIIFFLVTIALVGVPGSMLLLIFGHGLMQGFVTVNANLSFPRLFGLAHLGAISGSSMKWSVLGSAVGPYIYSVFFNVTDGYRLISLLLIVPCAALTILAVKDHALHRCDHRGDHRADDHDAADRP